MPIPKPRQTVPVTFTPSPLTCARLLVLAKLESGGARPDVGPVIARLAEEALAKHLGGRLVLPTDVDSYAPDVPTDPRELVKVYEGRIWEMLRRQENPRTRREPAVAPESDANDMAILRGLSAELRGRAAHVRKASAKMREDVKADMEPGGVLARYFQALGLPMTPQGEAMARSEAAVQSTAPLAPVAAPASKPRDNGVSFGGAFRDGGYEVDESVD